MVTQPMRDLYIFHYYDQVNRNRPPCDGITVQRDLHSLFANFVPSSLNRGFPFAMNIGFICESKYMRFSRGPCGLAQDLIRCFTTNNITDFHLWLIDIDFRSRQPHTVMTREQDQWRRGENGNGPPALFHDFNGKEYIEVNVESNIILLSDNKIVLNGPGIVQLLRLCLTLYGAPPVPATSLGVLVPRH